MCGQVGRKTDTHTFTYAQSTTTIKKVFQNQDCALPEEYSWRVRNLYAMQGATVRVGLSNRYPVTPMAAGKLPNSSLTGRKSRSIKYHLFEWCFHFRLLSASFAISFFHPFLSFVYLQAQKPRSFFAAPADNGGTFLGEPQKCNSMQYESQLFPPPPRGDFSLCPSLWVFLSAMFCPQGTTGRPFYFDQWAEWSVV